MSGGQQARHGIVVLLAVDDTDVADPFGAIATARAIAAPSGIPVIAVAAGRSVPQTTAAAALQAGADTVHLVTHPGLALPPRTDQLLAVFTAVLPQVAGPERFGAVLHVLAAGATGEELAARLAARLGAAALGRCSAISATATGFVAQRPAYGGRAELGLAADGPCFAAVRRPATAVPGRAQVGGEVRCVALDIPLPNAGEVTWEHGAGGMARLDGARIVVAGGRGVGGAAGFAQLQQIAAALDGALAGSLPAVDAGWVGVAQQVGQSGRHVTPDVYLAIGISGTPQHMAGVGLSARIFAVNSDPEAAIFGMAEVGVVADWQQIVPDLLRALTAQPAAPP